MERGARSRPGPGIARLLLLGFLAALFSEAVLNALYKRSWLGLVDNPAILASAAVFGPAIVLITEPVLRRTRLKLADTGLALALLPALFLIIMRVQSSALGYREKPENYAILWVRVADALVVYTWVRLRLERGPGPVR